MKNSSTRDSKIAKVLTTTAQNMLPKYEILLVHNYRQNWFINIKNWSNFVFQATVDEKLSRFSFYQGLT